jgi:hypothetical protein
MGLGTKGFGPASGYRFSGFRYGNLDGRNNNFKYPSAWWDVAHMELPKTVKHLFRWCRYHVLLNALIAPAVRKMASYPITDVTVQEDDIEGFNKNHDRWHDLLQRVLNIQRAQNEIGLDYWGFGNAIVSLSYPFYKWLQCRSCSHMQRITKLRYRKDWDFRNFEYQLNCPKCKSSGPAKVRDIDYRSYKDIKLIRWNPEDIDIDFNPITQNAQYAYTIPSKLRAAVLQKKKSYLETLPKIFIQAMKTRRPVVLHPENLFHFKAPTPSLASNDQGWGYPPILPALKDSFYLQMMKKGQEAVIMERLMPLDILYPATGDQSVSPYSSVNLSDWKRRVELEIVKWKQDPGYRPIMPLPVGHQRIGGDGKALMLTNEIRAMSEHILAGMGAPQELVFGGLTWSGSSVSLRMLENQFLSYRRMHEHFLRHFLVPSVAAFMGWKEVKVNMSAFKMADDVQGKQMLMSLNQLRKVSDKTLLAEFGKDALDELRIIEGELRRNLEVSKLDALYKAQIQGEQQKVLGRYQKKMQEEQMKGAAAQQAGAPPGGAPQGGAPQGEAQGGVIDMAEAYSKKIARMPPEQSAQILQRMQQESPQLHDLVQQKLQVMKALEQKPLPERRAPSGSQAGI